MDKLLSHPPADGAHLDASARICYDMARSIVGFFDAAEFLARWPVGDPPPEHLEMLLDRFSFNGDRCSDQAPAFLWSDGYGSYVFVGFNGAPKGSHNRLRKAAARSSGDITGLHMDIARGRAVAQSLYEAFQSSGSGIFGERRQSQTLLPERLVHGSRDHLLFLTFTNCVNRTRDALDLWRRCCRAWSNRTYRYLFEPGEVQAAGLEKVRGDLVRLGISRKHQIDCAAWYQIAKTLDRKWQGDPSRFLDDCHWHAPTVMARLRADLTEGKPAFPLLRGAKIAPLWLRMLRDDAGITFTDMADIPIAVDVHVLRATLCSGVITGSYHGRGGPLFGQVRHVWRAAMQGLTHETGEPMVALDVDEALWTLSRLGCSRRGNGALNACPADCPLAGSCTTGDILIQNGICSVETELP